MEQKGIKKITLNLKKKEMKMELIKITLVRSSFHLILVASSLLSNKEMNTIQILNFKVRNRKGNK